MRTHEEIELKWALDAAAHARLGALLPERLGPGRILDQENRFYDTADRRLRGAGLSVRLRREDARLLLTCKRRLGAVDGLHRHEEREAELDPGLWAAAAATLPPAVALPDAWRAAAAGAPLVRFGAFANRRVEFHDGAELLCLDATDFGTRLDHELEIETPDPAAAAARWTAQLAAWGVGWRPQPLTKLARLLALGAG